MSVIKALIIGNLLNFGYAVEQDTEYSLTLTRPVEGMENIAASIGAGNSYSTNRRVATFTFVKQPEGVRVVASSAWRAQMPGGQVRTSSLDDNGQIFNALQKELLAIKEKVEKH
jgi:hypothetical protein